MTGLFFIGAREREAAAGPALSLLSLLSLLAFFFLRERARIREELKREAAEGGTAQFAQCTQFTEFTSLLAFFLLEGAKLIKEA